MPPQPTVSSPPTRSDSVVSPQTGVADHRLAALTRDEVRRVGADGLVVVPFGATEQHGPHLPVGTDTLHVVHVASQAARAVADEFDVAVAPAMPYGCSEHHMPFGGTATLTSDTFLRVATEVVGSLVRSGCRRLFLLNGHGGNAELLSVAARDIAIAHSIDVASGNWWSVGDGPAGAPPTIPEVRVPGHAGGFETSVALALHPSLVGALPTAREGLPAGAVRDAAPRPSRLDSGTLLTGIDGYTDFPDRASPDAGRAYLERAVAATAEAFRAFMRATTPSSPHDATCEGA
jgi:creatinine amidohydrolase